MPEGPGRSSDGESELVDGIVVSDPEIVVVEFVDLFGFEFRPSSMRSRRVNMLSRSLAVSLGKC